MVVSLWKTPPNERSFSGLVDQAILETGRTQALLSVVQYVNLTVRECQAFGLFAQDLVEDIVASDASPYIWTRPNFFRSIRAIQYLTQLVYPRLKLPGNQQADLVHYFYAASDYFVFNGLLSGESLGMACYFWQKPLRYFATFGVNTDKTPLGPYVPRPAYYDMDTEIWMYLNLAGTAYEDTLGDDDEEALRRRNAANWLILNWYDMILEGTKAKLFKQYSDERAVISYANYKAAQDFFRNTTGFEAESFNNVG